jgi:DNA-binding XRE family transcriptional regulator
MTKTKSVQELLKKELKNPAFKKAYESFSEEYNLAEEVIQLRLKVELTQTELAHRAHTSQPAISRLESGNYANVSMAFLRKVGAALGATPVVHFKTS